MKRHSMMVTLALVILVILTGCVTPTGDETNRAENDVIDHSFNAEGSRLNEDEVPEYVQKIYERYSQTIDQHGVLFSGIGSEIEKHKEKDKILYSFTLLPKESIASEAQTRVIFNLEGNKSIFVSAKDLSRSYIEELLAHTLLVIDPGMKTNDTREIVDKLVESCYENGKIIGDSDQVIIGDYTVFLIGDNLPTICAVSPKMGFDAYDFDKSQYDVLTYDIYNYPSKYKNKLFYVEGTYVFMDERQKEIVDSEGNHFMIETEERLLESVIYRLYGTLRIDVYGEPYFYVQYSYGI